MTSEIDNQHSIVSILERCLQYVQNKWTKKVLKHNRENSVYPGFDSLVQFMNEVATEACDPVFGHNGKMSKGAKVNTLDMTSGSYITTITNTSESNTVHPVHTSSSPKGPCVLCAQNHRLFACDAFRAMGPQERFGVVKNYKLCFNCLMSGHRAYKCKKQSVCSVPACGKKHSRFIHVDPVPQPSAVFQVTRTSNLSAGNSGAGNNGAHAAGNSGNIAASGNVSSVFANCHKGNAYLPIVLVIVNGNFIAHALLDTSSTNTLMSESLANKLTIPGQDINYNLSTMSDRGVSSSKVVSVQLALIGGGDPVNVDNVLVVSGNLVRYPVLNVDLQKFPHLSDLPLCPLDQSGVVDLVIGIYNGHLLMPFDIRRNPKLVNEPYAIRSYFGCSLYGYNGGSSSDMYGHFVALDRQVENLWN